MEPGTALEGDPGVPAPRPRIAVTHGDPNGIGPEVVLRCLIDARMQRFFEPVLVGSAHVFRVHAEKLGLDIAFRSLEESPDSGALAVHDIKPGEEPPVNFGAIAKEAGQLSMQAVTAATDLALAGKADAVVTAPISKEAIALADYAVRGHTEFIAQRAGSKSYAMMLVADGLRVGLVTGHMSIWNVPKRVTTKAILEKINVMTNSLQRDFGIPRPKIAVLGLNPHAGDGGVLGREEGKTISPAILQCRDTGTLVFGPFSADGFFGAGSYRHYDAVLAMYHDQGLVPFKTLAFGRGVNYTAGLPIVRTSPDHGTAFDIAGQGKASYGSMRSALFLARDIVRERRRQAS